MLAQVRHCILRVQPPYVLPTPFVSEPLAQTYLVSVGGGFFTGRYRSIEDQVEPGSRFDPNKGQGKVRPPISLAQHTSFDAIVQR